MAEGWRKSAARFAPWLAVAVLLAIYLNLPEAPSGGGAVEEPEPAATSSEKLEIVSVRPLDPNPRSAVVIRYSGPGEVIGADFGKKAMEIIERPPGP